MEKLNISLFYNTISDERFLTSHCAINLFYQNLTYKNLIGTNFNETKIGSYSGDHNINEKI